jgi:hypothetical protein
MKIKSVSIIKTLAVKIFAAAMILATLDATAFAQTRIRFARGRTSTTVSGALSGGASRSYILGARRGQTMTVRVTSTSGSVWIDIGGNDVGKGETITLRSTDDYIITVHNDGNGSTRFSLYVSIR